MTTENLCRAPHPDNPRNRCSKPAVPHDVHTNNGLDYWWAEGGAERFRARLSGLVAKTADDLP